MLRLMLRHTKHKHKKKKDIQEGFEKQYNIEVK
jgi:hypothetical protein